MNFNILRVSPKKHVFIDFSLVNTSAKTHTHTGHLKYSTTIFKQHYDIASVIPYCLVNSGLITYKKKKKRLRHCKTLFIFFVLSRVCVLWAVVASLYPNKVSPASRHRKAAHWNSSFCTPNSKKWEHCVKCNRMHCFVNHIKQYSIHYRTLKTIKC